MRRAIVLSAIGCFLLGLGLSSPAYAVRTRPLSKPQLRKLIGTVESLARMGGIQRRIFMERSVSVVNPAPGIARVTLRDKARSGVLSGVPGAGGYEAVVELAGPLGRDKRSQGGKASQAFPIDVIIDLGRTLPAYPAAQLRIGDIVTTQYTQTGPEGRPERKGSYVQRTYNPWYQLTETVVLKSKKTKGVTKAVYTTY